MIGGYFREDEEKNIPQLMGALPQEIKWQGWEVYLRKNLDEYFKSMNKSQKIIMDFVVFFPLFYFIIPALFSCIYFIYLFLCCHSNSILPTVIEIFFILIDLFCVLILSLYFHRARRKYTLYLFSWDNVPGNDGERLLRFLRDDLDIGWAENAEIIKSDDGKIINIVKDENSAEITIAVKKKKATLKISDGRTHELKVKKEDDKLNIYYTLRGCPTIQKCQEKKDK